MKYALAVAFLGCILAANYAIGHVGQPPAFPGGPHTLPVGFGLDAPSGVYLVGLTLVLRDLVQRHAGKLATFALIVLATVLVATFAPSLALASGVAFFVSEVVDFGVFSATERFGEVPAVLASNAASIVVDSALFLAIAFGSLQFVEGQVVGKAWGTLAGLVILLALRTRRAATA